MEKEWVWDDDGPGKRPDLILLDVTMPDGRDDSERPVELETGDGRDSIILLTAPEIRSTAHRPADECRVKESES